MHEKARKSNARRKPFDVVLMFKMLVLQTLYNLADEQVEYRIHDRLSFSRFLGLGIEDAVPDATTVWRFRERLQEQGLLETVFDRFDDFLAAEGFEARQGSLMLPSLRCRFPAITARRTAGSRRVRFPKTSVGRNGRKKMWMGAGRESAAITLSATRITSVSTRSTKSSAASKRPRRICA